MDLNEIINQEKKLITTKYLEMQKAAEDIYGEKTVILIEIGSFYEIYQANGIGKAGEISKEINIILTRKNKSIIEETESNPSLCGIPSVSLEKYLDILTERNWTIIIVSQIGTPPNIKREVTKVISPGTNVDYIKDENYNFIASVFIEKNKDNIFYAGLSMIDLSTGKVLSFENYGSKNDKEIAIDEIINIIKANNCKEIILFQDEKNDLIDKISLNNKILCTSKEIPKKSLNINYQNELLKNIFNLQTFLTPIEELDMERTPNALNALTLLIEFIAAHNMKIISNLKKPINVKNKTFMYLGNNALEQLNIVNDNNKNNLINIINNGCSAIGKRFITDQLKNPLIDPLEINKRYELSKLFIDSNLRDSIRKCLKSIYDIERISRKIDLINVNPSETHNLYISIIEIQSIIEILSSKTIEYSLFGLSNKEVIKIKQFINEMENNFELSKLACFNMTNITSSFVKEGVSNKIDELNQILRQNYLKINKRGYELSKLLTDNESLSSDENPRNIKIDNINIGFNDTEGFFFEITNNKFKLIKEKVESNFPEYKTKILKGSIKLYFNDISNLSDEIILLELRSITLNKEFFLSYINTIDLNMDRIVLFISNIEFMVNNALLKDKFRYCTPEIVDIEDSFIESVQLRHPIIEQIQNEIFIPNNVVLGDKNNCKNKELMENIFQGDEKTTGIMLYGLNSAGKTSLIKSVGISIVLAQAGFYVPATEFRYSIFENVFTRVTESDNIYKGLSTFAIEMLELKNIFNRANNKTLVLGDEIAHGTETVSALSIVASAVLRLTEIKALFMFATHLHQLKDIEDVQNEKSIKNMHIDVEYHEDTGELIYNRTILPGQGSSMYGLEFAKFMQMDKTFLSRAYEIRRDVSSKLDGIELLTSKKKSLYNNEKYLGSCEVCGEGAEEVHHIAPQRDADEKGIIDYFHKDHKANLLSVCHQCHMDIEHGDLVILGKKMTSSGLKVIKG